MDWIQRLEQLLGKPLPGPKENVPAEVFWGADAAEQLADALKRHVSGRRAAILFDVRTREAAGERCVEQMAGAGWRVETVLVRDSAQGRSPVCDDATMKRLDETVGDCDVFVAVGSGVINDLSKWLAGSRGVPYAVFATAASMNGYSSANVAATVGGLKTLVSARAARVIAADPDVIASAPSVMAAAGLGDMLAKPFSSSDWFVNHVLFDEPFDQRLIDMVEPFERIYLREPEGIAKGNHRVLRALFEGLVASGCAMTLHGSSLPASGGEHLISHTLDMIAAARHAEHDLHGRQVGVASIFVADLYRDLLRLVVEAENGSGRTFGATVTPFRPDVWGPFAETVQRQHAQKTQKVLAAVQRLDEPGVWERAKQGIRKLVRTSEQVRSALAAAGGAVQPSDLGLTNEQWQVAVNNAGAMRARLTSLDLAVSAGILNVEGP